MLKSMTGFAYKKTNVKGVGEFVVNLRSYNNRFLDINIKTSRGLDVIEKMIFEKISKSISRGRIDVYIGFTPDKKNDKVEIANLKRAKNKIAEIKKELSIKDQTSLGMILSYAEKENRMSDALSKSVIDKAGQVLTSAVTELVGYKKKQGVSIKKDLGSILKRLRKMNLSFEAFLKSNLKDTESVSKDVFEEFSLISFYINQLEQMLNAKEQRIGKKLDFLSQELLREVNTLQAKIKDKKISLQALYFKEEIERIREISNNIE